MDELKSSLFSNKMKMNTVQAYVKAIHIKVGQTNSKTVEQAQELNPYYNQLNPS